MKHVAVSVLLLAALAIAQSWQVELVDTSCRPTDVFVKRDSGRTYVAYVTGEGSIRIASKDAIWRYQTLDTSLVRPDAGIHFAAGPGGRMAVSGVDDSTRPVVLERVDSGWVRVWTHTVLDPAAPLARAVYGADSIPIVIYAVNNYTSASYVIAETWVDSVWQVDTAASFVPPHDYGCELTLYDADCSPDAGPCFMTRFAYWFPPSMLPPTYEVGKDFRAGSGWRYVGLGGGFQAAVDGYDIVAGGPDTASAAVYSGGRLKFDQDSVWPAEVRDAAVQVDSAGREQIAFVSPDSVLRFAYKDTRWHFRQVPGVTTATCCDLALDETGQPVIAFEDTGGLWLAHGADMLGAGESPKSQASRHKLAATVVRGVLMLGAADSRQQTEGRGALLDAAGRRVMELHAGANDVSRLARGVYFVREVQAQAQAQAVRKVVVTQ
ncbi:MAG TPA: hypothetical protein VMH22_07045 [bacterium]|nr:hypothetical protein [bacterium]